MKKRFAYLMTVSAMAVALTGCGGTASSSTTSSSENSSTNSSNSSNSSSSSSQATDPITLAYEQLMARTSANPIAIDMWHGFGSGPTPHLEAAVADFETLFPSIDVTLTSKGGYDNLKKATTLEISTGNYPDVVLGYPDHFAEYLSGGMMVALEPYINSNHESIGIDLSDFHQYYVDENQQFEAGKTYGLPFNKSTEVMIYNKTFFDAHELEVPSTWAEVRTVTEQILTIVRAVINGPANPQGKKIDTVSGLDFTNVSSAQFYPMSYDSQENLFITIIRQWGGTYTELGENYEQGFIRFNNETTRTAINYFKTMYDDNLFGPPQIWEEPSYASRPFKALKTLIGVTSSAGVYNNISDSGSYELGVAPLPYNTADKAYVIQQGTNIALLNSNNTVERMAGWLLIRYLTGDGNPKFALGASYMPVRKSGAASELYQEFITSTPLDPNTKSKVDAARIANFYLDEENDVEWQAFTDPGFIGSSEIRDTIDLFFPGITVGQKAYDTMMNEIIALLPYYVE